MKQTTIAILILSAFSCAHSVKSAHIKNDTSIVSIIVKNPYNNYSVEGARSYRVIKDSAHIDGDVVTHLPDTNYYISLSFTLKDPADSTHQKLLKTKSGKDSIVFLYKIVLPVNVLKDFNDKTAFRP